MRRRAIALVFLALTVLSGSAGAHGLPSPLETRPEVFTWGMAGESPHWVVILHGYAQREHGRVTYAHVRPYVIWVGGGQIPREYEAEFTVQGVDCGPATVTRTAAAPPTRLDVHGTCKLVYPRSPSVSGTRAEDFIAAIKNDGRFVLTWDDQHETIGHWR